MGVELGEFLRASYPGELGIPQHLIFSGAPKLQNARIPHSPVNFQESQIAYIESPSVLRLLLVATLAPHVPK